MLEAFTHVTPEEQAENPYEARSHRWWAFQFINVCRADFVISRETLLSAGTDGPGEMYKNAAAYYYKCIAVCDFLLHHLTTTDEERPYSRIKQARMKRESKRARKSGNA